MAAEGHIQQVWTGVHSSERLYRYYGRLESKLQRLHVTSLVFIGVASSGAAAALLGHLPDFLSAILFFLVAGATIWVFTADYSKRSAIAGLATGQWGELALEWERLWYDLDDLNGEEIVGRMLALQQRERIVGKGPPPIPKKPPPPPPPRRPKPSSSGAGADTNLIRRRYERAR